MAANKSANISSSSLPFLPSELILEIFSRLPSKSLQRFRSIFDDDFQKSVDTFEFQHKHAFNVLNQSSNERLLIASNHAPLSENFSINEVDPYPCMLMSSSPSITQTYVPKQIFKDILSFDMINNFYYSIIGASNGLICLYFGFDRNMDLKKGRCEYLTNHYLILWNPCTKECHTLPLPQGFNLHLSYYLTYPTTKCGFGYDTANKTYKLVMIDGVVTQIYDLSTNLWKVIETIHIDWSYIDDVVETSDPTLLFGQYLNGSLHWVVSSTNIASIDLSNEVSNLIDLPRCFSNEHCLNLGVLNGCLSISCYWCERGHLKLKIWVMKEYGRGETWSNIATIKLDPSEMRLEPHEMVYRPPLLVSRDEKMLFLIEGQLAYLFPMDEKFCYLNIHFDVYCRGIVHVDTLVSPKPEIYGSSKDDNHNKALVSG